MTAAAAEMFITSSSSSQTSRRNAAGRWVTFIDPLMVYSRLSSS